MDSQVLGIGADSAVTKHSVIRIWLMIVKEIHSHQSLYRWQNLEHEREQPVDF